MKREDEMKSRLREIVLQLSREDYGVECTEVGGMLLPLCKIMKYDVYIYGCGENITPLIGYFINSDVNFLGIIDKDKKKAGQKILDLVPIIHTDEFIANCKRPEETFVFINTVFFEGITQMEITKVLTDAGVTKFYDLKPRELWRIRRYEGGEISLMVNSDRIQYCREHLKELESTMDLLEDMESKEIMLEFIRAHVQCGIYHLPACDGRVKYFYGKTIEAENKVYEELYKHMENEVWINCGSSIGDSIFLYFVCGLNAEKIYAFEGDTKIYKKLCQNLSLLPDQYRDKVEPINEILGADTDFTKILGDKKISLINADIDGAELEMLKGISNKIKQDRPVIAICAYHRSSDLTDMVQYLDSLVEEYIFVLRKYPAGGLNLRNTSELVLYAIPKERRV